MFMLTKNLDLLSNMIVRPLLFHQMAPYYQTNYKITCTNDGLYLNLEVLSLFNGMAILYSCNYDSIHLYLLFLQFLFQS